MQAIVERGASSVDALTTVAYHLYSVGRNREGFERARQTRDLDPLSELAQTSHSYGVWCTGTVAEARAAMEASVRSSPDNHHAVGQLIITCALQQDWTRVEALIDPMRLAKYPLREFRAIVGLVAVMRDPTPENRQLLWETIRSRIEATSHADATMLIWPAHFGFVSESYELLDKVKLGPSGGKGDILGASAYRRQMLFLTALPELRADPRFVKLCARLGLVEYWLTTQAWPDCAKVVPYDFRAECEKHRDYPKDKFFR